VEDELEGTEARTPPQQALLARSLRIQDGGLELDNVQEEEEEVFSPQQACRWTIDLFSDL